MNKIIYLLTFLLLPFFMGCDDSSSSSSGSVIEVQCQIQGITPVAFKDGDIGFYDCGAYRIIITENTKLLHTRDSCSGLASVEFGYPSTGDILFVGYKSSNADFASSPTVIRATYVEGYKQDCISGGGLPETDPTCDVCPDPFFD